VSVRVARACIPKGSSLRTALEPVAETPQDSKSCSAPCIHAQRRGTVGTSSPKRKAIGRSRRAWRRPPPVAPLASRPWSGHRSAHRTASVSDHPGWVVRLGQDRCSQRRTGARSTTEFGDSPEPSGHLPGAPLKSRRRPVAGGDLAAHGLHYHHLLPLIPPPCVASSTRVLSSCCDRARWLVRVF
jgi:hypothetical protein